MQFSLKWLLAGVTYAAIACASINYAGEAWVDIVAIGRFLLLAGAIAAIPLVGRASRPFFIGFAVVGAMLQLVMLDQARNPTPVRRALERGADAVASRFPTPDRNSAAAEYFGARKGFNVLAATKVYELEGEFRVDLMRHIDGKDVVVHDHRVPSSVLAGFPSREDRTAILVEHLQFLLSVIGGCLEWWCFRRQTKIDAKTANAKEA